MAVNIQAPDVQAFGAYGPAYAATLSRRSQNNGANILNQLALKMLAQQEQGSYLDAVSGANQQALEGADIEQQGNLAGKYFDTLAPNTNAGVGRMGAEAIAGNRYVDVSGSMAAQEQADNIHLDSQLAASQQARGAALDSMIKAGEKPEDVGAYIAGPTTPLPTDPYVTFDDTTGRINANANMISAQKPPSDGNSGDNEPKIVIEYDRNGTEIARTVTSRGDPRSDGPTHSQDATPAERYIRAKTAKGGKATRISDNIVKITSPNGTHSIYMHLDANGSYTLKEKP